MITPEFVLACAWVLSSTAALWSIAGSLYTLAHPRNSDDEYPS